MKEHILVVDAMPHSRFTIGNSLKKAGYRVSEAEDGREALSMIIGEYEKGGYFNLALVSIRMSGMSGVELIYELEENHISIPVMVVSDFVNRTLITELVRNCCSDFLLKPFESPELVRRVEGVLNKHENRFLN